MRGIYLNLILACLAVLALTAGISFFVSEKESGHTRIAMLCLGIDTFFICMGYAVMGFMPNVDYAYIPRLAGLCAIDIFLLIELAFLSVEVKFKQSIQIFVLGFFILYAVLDIIIFGRPSAIIYVRYDFHTAYENVPNGGAFAFHYSYVSAIAIALMIHGVHWYKGKKLKRDKQFVVELILANFVILFAAFPDMFKGAFSTEHPTFSYSVAFAAVCFSFWFAIKQHNLFSPTVKNVSREIFHSLNVPILIFDMDGIAHSFNSCAQKSLHITEGESPTLRTIFTLSDVETLHLLARAKNGGTLQKETKIKEKGKEKDKETTEKSCTIHLTTKLDNVGEPFCIICTVLPVCNLP